MPRRPLEHQAHPIYVVSPVGSHLILPQTPKVATGSSSVTQLIPALRAFPLGPLLGRLLPLPTTPTPLTYPEPSGSGGRSQ